MSDNLPFIGVGQRATIAGRSGSGKSTLGCWLLKKSPGHWLILNPKNTKAYSKLLPFDQTNTVNGINFSKIEKSVQEFKFTIVTPTIEQSTPDNLDDFVYALHSQYEKLGLCVDELYTMHKNGQAGQGLIAWLTRGRELGQSYIGMTQRPAWVSKFVFSESNFIGGMSLNLNEDRKRMYEMTGEPAMLDKLPPFEWLWYAGESDTLRKFGAVPMK